MGQRLGLVISSLMLMTIGIACEKSPAPASANSATTGPITVASLSPAATEILIGMGLADRLVAVSNFDPSRTETKNLPRVGDYQTTDWERLASLRPSVMVTQFAADRLPAGLSQKADSLNIQLLNVSITRLDDIYRAMAALGEAMGEPQRGADAQHALRSRLDALASRVSGRKVRTLIVVDDAGQSVVGRDNYLNDLLELAGGENVIRPPSAPYPSIDRERLIELDPEVIFQLLPNASPQVQTSARQVWQSLPQLQAVKNGRVHIFTQQSVLYPSDHVADLAEQFGKVLMDTRTAATRPGAS